MKYPPRFFSPAGRVMPVEETSEDRLVKKARALLPRIRDDEETRTRRGGKRYRGPRYCACGERLHGNAKIRQGRQVCDDCARIIPRLPGGRKKLKND